MDSFQLGFAVGCFGFLAASGRQIYLRIYFLSFLDQQFLATRMPLRRPSQSSNNPLQFVKTKVTPTNSSAELSPIRTSHIQVDEIKQKLKDDETEWQMVSRVMIFDFFSHFCFFPEFESMEKQKEAPNAGFGHS